MNKKNRAGSMILGVAFVWFTTHFGGGFASGAQIYSYYVRYGVWSLFLPLFAWRIMAFSLHTVFPSCAWLRLWPLRPAARHLAH